MAHHASQPETQPVYKARSRLAVATRLGRPEQVAEARRDLAAANLESYVSRIVASAPPLTDDQADRIAALLRPAAGGGTR